MSIDPFAFPHHAPSTKDTPVARGYPAADCVVSMLQVIDRTTLGPPVVPFFTL